MDELRLCLTAPGNTKIGAHSPLLALLFTKNGTCDGSSTLFRNFPSNISQTLTI